MAETNYQLTRKLNVTATEYEVIMHMTATQSKGNRRVVQTLTVKTTRPYLLASSGKQDAKAVSDYDVA